MITQRSKISPRSLSYGTLIVIIAFLRVQFLQEAAAQEAGHAAIFYPKLHLLDARTAEGLRELFRPTADPIPFVSAHRGGAQRDFPENCIATFEKTLSLTFSILEIDPRYASDGTMVVHHDATLDRTTTGKGPVAMHSLQALKKLRLKDPNGKVTDHQIPTLDEVFEWARGKTVIVLDQKDVPTSERVRKITEHRAESFAMIIANTFKDASICYSMNPNVMMEVMIADIEKAKLFDQLGIPWSNVVAFVGHTPPQDKSLYQFIHSKGASCMVGSSRNVDRKWIEGNAQDKKELTKDYKSMLERGADIIETDIPTQVGPLLFSSSELPDSKKSYMFAPIR
jgi:glycerophosphoryl diester phosphodiesterase